MTQEERWQAQYDQMMAFMEENHRRPSKYKLEEHDMLNWFKSNKKMMNKGIFPEERLERFNKLLELAEKYRRLRYAVWQFMFFLQKQSGKRQKTGVWGGIYNIV